MMYLSDDTQADIIAIATVSVDVDTIGRVYTNGRYMASRQ